MQTPDGPSLGYDGDNVVRTNYDSAAVNWTIVHGPSLDDPLIGHYVVMSGTSTISKQAWVYFGPGQPGGERFHREL